MKVRDSIERPFWRMHGRVTRNLKRYNRTGRYDPYIIRAKLQCSFAEKLLLNRGYGCMGERNDCTD